MDAHLIAFERTHADQSADGAAGAARHLALCRVVSVAAGGGVLAFVDGEAPFECGILDSCASGGLRGGDEVLVWRDGRPGGRAVVMGRVRGGEVVAAEHSASDTDEIVIEARKSLTLRVGDGSITIREDGRILIQGKDLVSHAKGMNRIRGGSVAIN